MSIHNKLLCIAACLLATIASASRAAELAGGVRPVEFAINGEWIGNGVCFSPFRHGQSPSGAAPSAAEVAADVSLAAKHWGLFRTYEFGPVVENELKAVREQGLSVRFLMGVWIVPEKTPEDVARNDAQVAAGIRAACDYKDLVLAVIVGNETQVEWSGIRTDPQVLIRRIRQVRAGIEQPVTTADDYNYWNKPASQEVAAEVDFITLHMYPLWNGRGLDEAMEWTEGVYQDICKRHPERRVIIGETGWATSHAIGKTGQGEEGALMKAETSVAAQEKYLKQYYAWVWNRRVPTVLFEAFDEEWKGSGSGKQSDEAEKHWGVFTENREPKASFVALLKAVPEATRRR